MNSCKIVKSLIFLFWKHVLKNIENFRLISMRNKVEMFTRRCSCVINYWKLKPCLRFVSLGCINIFNAITTFLKAVSHHDEVFSRCLFNFLKFFFYAPKVIISVTNNIELRWNIWKIIEYLKDSDGWTSFCSLYIE